LQLVLLWGWGNPSGRFSLLAKGRQKSGIHCIRLVPQVQGFPKILDLTRVDQGDMDACDTSMQPLSQFTGETSRPLHNDACWLTRLLGKPVGESLNALFRPLELAHGHGVERLVTPDRNVK
jgi:hypothetical protein